VYIKEKQQKGAADAISSGEHDVLGVEVLIALALRLVIREALLDAAHRVIHAHIEATFGLRPVFHFDAVEEDEAATR
jgi:hypothetical protein